MEKPDHPVRVLQFGEGNFLRAFVDWMIDIANEKGETDMAVAIVSPRFKDNEGIKTLQAQDGLYHVWLEGIENGWPKSEPRAVRCIADAFSPVVDPDRYERCILSPDLRFVVSNTTEAGIRFEKDDILSSLPGTFPGKIASLLHRRFLHFKGDRSKGLIFLCCELIEDNGTKLKEYVVRHSEEAGLGVEFKGWIDESCIFCDTLVDRIVPGYPSDSISEIKEKLGYDDNLVVKGELFHIWAIGSEKYGQVSAEFPLDKAGLNVMFMPSIKSFRDKKVRILNGSHTGMVPVALQLGCNTVLDAFTREDVSRFIKTMVQREVLPMIDEDPDELRHFADSILERFYNPYMRHMLKSIALNSLSKWETRNFPTIRDYSATTGSTADFGIFTFAALLSLYLPESGFTPEDNQEHLAIIRAAHLHNHSDCRSMIKEVIESGIFLENLESEAPGFTHKAADYLEMIQTQGMEKALAAFLDSHNY